MLTIRGQQEYEDMEPDETELVTEGVLEKTPEGYCFRYTETELTGMEGTVTAFDVQGGRITLTRAGSVNSQMVFEEGKQHTSLYETPYGELSVDIHTRSIRHTLSENGGLLDIRYSISVDHMVTGQSAFRIRIRRRTS